MDCIAINNFSELKFTFTNILFTRKYDLLVLCFIDVLCFIMLNRLKPKVVSAYVFV